MLVGISPRQRSGWTIPRKLLGTLRGRLLRLGHTGACFAKDCGLPYRAPSETGRDRADGRGTHPLALWSRRTRICAEACSESNPHQHKVAQNARKPWRLAMSRARGVDPHTRALSFAGNVAWT